MTTQDKQRAEAVSRIRTLINELGLNPKVEGYFVEGKVYCSYLTAAASSAASTQLSTTPGTPRR